MTQITSTTTADSTTTGTSIDRFLEAVTSGSGIPTDVYTDDATLDATVPNWRFGRVGSQAIATEYARWFADPAAFDELRRTPTSDGEVVTYLLTWTDQGVPHAAHHCHVLRLAADGRIAADTVFCGGRWPASLLAQIAAAS
jgi:hypothetical protein